MTPRERNQAIERYRTGPAALKAAYDATPVAARKIRPVADAWSVHEIMIHCADSEANAYTRIRMLMAEDNPVIVGYDQDAWVERFDYHARPIETAFAVIASVHAHTVELLATFTDEDWQRAGVHSERDAYSADDWLRDYSAHLHDHVDQIQANIAALTPRMASS